MDRQDHLYYCLVCTKRQFNVQKGIVCSLTGEHANFDPTCPDFIKDEVAHDNRLMRDEINKISDEEDRTYGLSRFGIKNGYIAGALILVVALVWLLAGMNVGVIFFFPIGMLVIGFLVLLSEYIRTRKY